MSQAAAMKELAKVLGADVEFVSASTGQRLCSECFKQPADAESDTCVGCDAYGDHTA